MPSISPLNRNFKRLNADQRNEGAKKIILEVETGLIRAFNVAYGTTCKEKDTNQLERMAEDYNNLLRQLKIRFQQCNSFAEKRQLLTLAPSSWSYQQTAEYFECSIKLVRDAKELKGSEGVLPPLQPSTGRPISDFLRNKVVDFYLNDENSRQCPGKKDYISVDANHPTLKG
jgi:hypothetical protein